MRTKPTMLAIAALLMCAACADKSTTSTNLGNVTSQQFSSIHWDEATSASQSAVVSNGKLIFMR